MSNSSAWTSIWISITTVVAIALATWSTMGVSKLTSTLDKFNQSIEVLNQQNAEWSWVDDSSHLQQLHQTVTQVTDNATEVVKSVHHFSLMAPATSWIPIIGYESAILADAIKKVDQDMKSLNSVIES